MRNGWRRGGFTWNEDMKRWVWTTFNSYQWDLNYANPEVMRAMLEMTRLDMAALQAAYDAG